MVLKDITQETARLALLARENLEDAAALDAFIYNLYHGGSLTPQESKRALEDSVVKTVCYSTELKLDERGEITYSEAWRTGNGLMITENGYFITARHCVWDSAAINKYIIYRGAQYPVERVCMVSKSEREVNNAEDLALAKAKISGLKKPIQYKIRAEKIFDENTPIVVLTRRNDHLETLGGLVKSNKLVTLGLPVGANHMVITTKAVPGHSGSPVSSKDGEFMGLVSQSVAVYDNQTGLGFARFTTCAKAYRALELICLYSQHLKNKHAKI